jgi:hypothetical protein
MGYACDHNLLICPKHCSDSCDKQMQVNNIPVSSLLELLMHYACITDGMRISGVMHKQIKQESISLLIIMEHFSKSRRQPWITRLQT